MEKSAGSAERGISMDEMALKISNLRAMTEGQARTIAEQSEVIVQQAEEITRLRKRDVETTQAYEDLQNDLNKTRDDMESFREKYEELRDMHTQMVGQIMKLIEELKR